MSRLGVPFCMIYSLVVTCFIFYNTSDLPCNNKQYIMSFYIRQVNDT